MKICVVIKGPTFQSAYDQITQALPVADLIEIALDGFNSLDISEIQGLRAYFSIPMIFSLRNQDQGGQGAYSKKEHLLLICRLAALNPEYLDLQYSLPFEFIAEIASRHPQIKLICSYHNFKETPEDLEGLYQSLQHIPAHFYKIAVMARRCTDALRFLCWAKKYQGKLITVCMGVQGQVGRILASVVGCPIMYASLHDAFPAAPGQLSALTLKKQYRAHLLSSDTVLYGLVGDPIDQSISDITHNQLLAHYNLNAVYVKMTVSLDEISHFLPLAKQLGFRGMSVTMPLKEHIISFLDDIDNQAQEIGAVNTLLFNQGKIIGINTDGIGALNAVEQICAVKGKHCVLIGAGGAARAIAYEALCRGAQVTILNRDARRAFHMANDLGCLGLGIDKMSFCADKGYDILINCTPHPLPIDVQYILSCSIVMDVTTKPRETLFLKAALEKGCIVIHGYNMFVEQALGQFEYWLECCDSAQEARKIIKSVAIDCI